MQIPLTFLQTAGGEKLERVHVVSEVDPDPLADVEGQRRHEARRFPAAARTGSHLGEGRVAGVRIHQQLAVERKAWERTHFHLQGMT